MARHAVLDFFGVMLAGYDEPLAQILRRLLASGGAASVLGGLQSANTRDAALINGATGHALDYDDVSVVGHPTAAILPAALAIGQAYGCSGKDILLSYIAGYEAASLVAAQSQPSHYERGFHSTGTLGAIGAAAATARLLELDSQKTAIAIGLAVTQAAGLKSQFGTMAKPFHAGKAASNGVLAAELAAAGFEGRGNMLEAEQGFFSTQSDVSPKSVGNYTFGQHIQRNLFKYHASCYCTHPVIESLRVVMDSVSFAPDDVESIEVHVPQGYLQVANINEPATGLESKFSIRQCAALKIAGYPTASIDTFNEHTANDRQLVELRRRISVIGDISKSTYMLSRVTVKLRNGSVHEGEYDVGRPETDYAVQQKKLVNKFENLVREKFGKRTETMTQQILAFDALTSMEDLAGALALQKAAR